MRLADRLLDRYRVQGYYEGMASGAAVLMTYNADPKREVPIQTLIASATQAFGTNGIVAAVIQARIMLLSEATFKLRNKVDKSLYGTEDLRILEYPWPNGTSGDLWARMELDVSLAGNAYIWKAEPDLLVRLPPAEITIVSEQVRDPSGRTYKRVIGYDWDPDKFQAAPGQPSQNAQFFTVDEVSHWTGLQLDPVANVRGQSWLTPVLREIAADSGMTEYKNQYLDHGTPVIAVKYPMKLRPDTQDYIEERVQAKFGGIANAFRPLTFDQGSDPILGAGLKDLDFAAVQDAGAERICSAGFVDPIIIGLRGGNRTVGAAYADARRRLADIWGRPTWRSGCAALQKLVPNIPPKGVELWFDTSDIAALQAAETERAQVTQVNAAAVLTLRQAQATFDSAVAAVASGDVSQLEFDPTMPFPGQRQGTPPGGGQVLTQAQTPASKKPMPDSFPTPQMSANGSAKNPTPNSSN